MTLVMSGGKATGSGGCNSFSGDYRLSGSTVAFGDVASTAMGCLQPGVNERESAFHRLLNIIRGWAIADDQLHLLDEAGTVSLVFRADPAR